MGLARFGEDTQEWVDPSGLESQSNGQKLFPAVEKGRAHWAVTAAVEGKGAVRTPPSLFLREGTNQRNFFLHGSPSHAVVSVRLRVDS